MSRAASSGRSRPRTWCRGSRTTRSTSRPGSGPQVASCGERRSRRLTMGAPDLTNHATGAASHEVRAGIPRALVAFLGRYPGLDVPALLAGAALSPARLADPEARVPAGSGTEGFTADSGASATADAV